MGKSACFLAASALLLGVLFVGCRETVMPVAPDPGTNLDQIALRPPSDGNPFVIIDTPAPPSPPGRVAALGRVIVFAWHSGLETEPFMTRWLCMQVVDTAGNYDPTFNIVSDLNEHPYRYESRWSKWVPFRNPHGRTTTAGADEPLQLSRAYIFAVQAKDHAGNVTTVFDRTKNVRQFIVSNVTPLLTIFEPYLGGNRFLGMNLRAVEYAFPPDVELSFAWRADAGGYGAQIAGYRYGWDVIDLEDKNDWEVTFSPDHTSAPAIAFQSGIHTLYVEALDSNGAVTLGRIELTIIPFTMERSLLWVDDFPSTNFQQVDYFMPTENEHDAFWLGQCAKASGFDPSQDVYDAYYGHNSRPPDLSLITRYRNIIWTYNASLDNVGWDDIVRFTPESLIGTGEPRLNYLPVYLAKGGHLLTEGNSERGGGLAAALMPSAMRFPMSLKCEITGNREDCDGDPSGVYSMPYKDYCVSIVDKILGTLRSDSDMPTRRARNYDVLYPCAVRSNDPEAGTLMGLPDTLGLWEEITKAGRYFDPQAPAPAPGGFTLVEVYDPAYWMQRALLTSQACFHPLYRMRTKSTLSALNNAAMALSLTKYADVVPDAGGGVAARSFHFGAELWYFNRQQGDRIINTILAEWQIGPVRASRTGSPKED